MVGAGRGGEWNRTDERATYGSIVTINAGASVVHSVATFPRPGFRRSFGRTPDLFTAVKAVACCPRFPVPCPLPFLDRRRAPAIFGLSRKRRGAPFLSQQL